MKRAASFIFIALFVVACGSGSVDEITKDSVTQNDISERYAIDYLSNKAFIFPAIDSETKEITYQSLERFDLIFVGYDLNSSIDNGIDLARAIPGKYTHLLTYIGKDSEGFAYAVEMNSSENLSYTVAADGLWIDGQLFVYCLGSDYGQKLCPEDLYIHGLDRYDHMWAKQLKPDLKKVLFEHEDVLINTIKDDLVNAFPFQVPFHIGPETKFTKIIPIVDDGRRNGTDCTSYVSSLFEEVANVCMDDIRMTASEWEAYYLEDPIGQQSFIDESFNIFTDGTIFFSDLLTSYGYSFTNNIPRKTSCPDGREVVGMATPDLVFDSPSLVDVVTVEAR